MSSSVIICTYRAPRELDFALCGLSIQTQPPDEILIADDGSGSETRQLIERWRDQMDCPLIHCWQADRGYRKARIVNEAVRQSTGDQLVFLDGDSFPHRHWVADHMQARTLDRVLCGRRVKLGPQLSRGMNRRQVLAGEFQGIGTRLLLSALRGDTKRLGLGLRVPQGIARILHPRPRHLMGVNYSLPRGLFFKVNGYDQAWAFYGREDLDLELRLRRAGVTFYPLLNRAIVYHVDHPERERSNEALALMAEQREAQNVRCAEGLELDGVFDAQA